MVLVSSGMSLADTAAFCKLMLDIYCMGALDDLPDLKIQRFHVRKLKKHLAAANTAGGMQEDFKCRICKSLLYNLIIQSNKLLYYIDPK